MPAQRVSNRQVRAEVIERRPFQNHGHSLYGEVRPDGTYVVYSYGPHFPLYVWRDGQWYGNKDKYSATTSRHASMARPGGVIIWHDTTAMQYLARGA